MNRYEELMHKAYLCEIAARNTKGIMRQYWIAKHNELVAMAGDIPLAELENK